MPLSLPVALPPWTVGFTYEVSPAIRRSFEGPTVQRAVSHRRTVIADASRRLRGNELAFFESFIRNRLNDGADRFVDVFVDGSGVQSSAIMRIVDGAYDVETDFRNHLFTCRLEIFR